MTRLRPRSCFSAAVRTVLLLLAGRRSRDDDDGHDGGEQEEPSGSGRSPGCGRGCRVKQTLRAELVCVCGLWSEGKSEPSGRRKRKRGRRRGKVQTAAGWATAQRRSERASDTRAQHNAVQKVSFEQLSRAGRPTDRKWRLNLLSHRRTGFGLEFSIGPPTAAIGILLGKPDCISRQRRQKHGGTTDTKRPERAKSRSDKRGGEQERGRGTGRREKRMKTSSPFTAGRAISCTSNGKVSDRVSETA